MALFGFKKEKKVEKVEARSTVKSATAPKVVAKKDTRKKAYVPKANTPKKAVAKVSSPVSDSVNTNYAGSIIRPHVTEKSGVLSSMGVYTFVVTKDSNKAMISRSVTSLYKVVPEKVAIVNLPDKKTFIRGRMGSVTGIRKALVTLKKGDKIDFV